MIQISIKKQNIITNQASFETQELADAWLSEHEGMGSFGSPRFSLKSVEISPAVFESREIIDVDPIQFEEVELSPAIWEDKLVETNPEGYEVEMEDISLQVKAESVNKVHLDYLASTDWLIIRKQETGQDYSEEIKTKRQSSRAGIV